jgi:SAM-dependent methyltransferase
MYIYTNFKDYTLEFEDFKNTIKNKNYLNGEYDTLYDLPFKYINILEHLKRIISLGKSSDTASDTTPDNVLLSNKIKNMIDPGCAYSSLSAYIAKRFTLENVYLFDFDIVSGKSIREEQRNIFSMNNIDTKIHFNGGDFYTNISLVPDNSIDLVIDGCSITHFCGNKGGIQSWNNFCKSIYSKLVDTGYVIISTDVKDARDTIDGFCSIETITGATDEFLYPNDIINIFSNHGFILASDIIISNDIIDLANLYPLRVVSMVFTKKLKVC